MSHTVYFTFHRSPDVLTYELTPTQVMIPLSQVILSNLSHQFHTAQLAHLKSGSYELNSTTQEIIPIEIHSQFYQDNPSFHNIKIF